MEALFIDGPEGRLFAIHHAAVPGCRQNLGLVYLPPFAEEMNRSRRMAALQGRRLAALGIDVLLLDPFGTGDSAGDFGDARWETWRADARSAIDWLGARCGGRVGLWGLRLGALLAAEVAAQEPARLDRLVLWQPVHSGERHLVQFLRLRVAAGMVRGGMASGGKRETVRDLRACLAQGEPVEVAGYALAPALAEAMAGRDLAPLLERLAGLRVDLLEVSAAGALAAATTQMLGAPACHGRPHHGQAVPGEPFWSIQEITLAPELLDATADLFRP